ncbi:MAG: cysteine desulfurase [Cytophagaceae bacterium]|nr:cysteine desulfurase [Cytophagaceae bacterium]MDW8456306.1 cysteine desulfurase family protein [Cytophagaceae bacterium]
MQVYLDNAASTPLDAAVLEEMLPYLSGKYGNPSSIHAHGREARAAIEKARKTVATLLHTSPSEIFFTSGGTESDNTALVSAIETYGIQHVISSPIEHHAVLHTLQYLEKKNKIHLHFVSHKKDATIEMESLEALLKKFPRSLVSIMHANNELGTLNDIFIIGNLCRQYDALFHCDTVQTAGYISLDLQNLPVDYLAISAHKFHGPKGVGVLYARAEKPLQPYIHGGAQERNMRGGTENVYGIVGLAKALEIAYQQMNKTYSYLTELKKYFIDQLLLHIPTTSFNGNSADLKNSLPTIINISLPESEKNEMLLFNMDIHKISVSSGSACASGSNAGSHVLNYLKADPARGHLRISTSRYNTKEEMDYVVEKLSLLYNY